MYEVVEHTFVYLESVKLKRIAKGLLQHRLLDTAGKQHPSITTSCTIRNTAAAEQLHVAKGTALNKKKSDVKDSQENGGGGTGRAGLSFGPTGFISRG